jgi:hypothetical protein
VEFGSRVMVFLNANRAALSEIKEWWGGLWLPEFVSPDVKAKYCSSRRRNKDFMKFMVHLQEPSSLFPTLTLLHNHNMLMKVVVEE